MSWHEKVMSELNFVNQRGCLWFPTSWLGVVDLAHCMNQNSSSLKNTLFKTHSDCDLPRFYFNQQFPKQ